jgi:hypothetical protein
VSSPHSHPQSSSKAVLAKPTEQVLDQQSHLQEITPAKTRAGDVACLSDETVSAVSPWYMLHVPQAHTCLIDLEDR